MKPLLIILLLHFMNQEQLGIISDFQNNIGTENWYTVDDGVMGGISQGNFNMNESGNALFSGTVRLENNGGFSSIRHSFEILDVSEFTVMKLKIKGDGKSYQFRLKEDSSQQYSYIQLFETSGDWQIIEIPLKSLYPNFRGNKLDKPNFHGNTIEEIGILIGNKVNENFKLEIEKIYLE